MAASVALLEMSVLKTSNPDIVFGFMSDISTHYFKPLFELLSSKSLSFPNGRESRVMICHSAIELLKKICDLLGRSRSTEVMMDSLQSFFNCYSTAHDKSEESSILTPVEGYFTEEEGGGTVPFPHPSLPLSEDPVAVEEVKETFGPNMVHRVYVDFCKMVGQISLNNHIRNKGVIDELHAMFSKKGRDNKREETKEEVKEEVDAGTTEEINYTLSLLGLTELESSTSSSGSTIGESNLDIPYQLGPAIALQGRCGLGPDSVSFGQSSWFVEPVVGEDGGRGGDSGGGVDAIDGGKQASSQVLSTSTNIASALRSTLSSSTMQHRASLGDAGGVVSSGRLEGSNSGVGPVARRGSALFDAKFGTTTPLSPGPDTSGGINNQTIETV